MPGEQLVIDIPPAVMRKGRSVGDDARQWLNAHQAAVILDTMTLFQM